MAVGDDAACEFRCALERQRGRRKRRADAVRREDIEDARRTRGEAVAVVALVSEIADRFFQPDAEFVDCLRPLVAVGNRRLGAFLHVHDERHGEARTIGPEAHQLTSIGSC
jgi:hypothetical protein